ncbi:hypothetical protein SeLEV6574_g04059 [Synchytrium endobioticum]|uniref:Metallo-beta-lactamase domain-containing protein n=1 Tax=Synchytrium endobioticum TaxID=286115 RepID=A0A507D1B1_9FUNG|nr:hypothetical protein SeLEV6574_g04059 [Synchytrium endobioticum]
MDDPDDDFEDTPAVVGKRKARSSPRGPKRARASPPIPKPKASKSSNKSSKSSARKLPILEDNQQTIHVFVSTSSSQPAQSVTDSAQHKSDHSSTVHVPRHPYVSNANEGHDESTIALLESLQDDAAGDDMALQYGCREEVSENVIESQSEQAPADSIGDELVCPICSQVLDAKNADRHVNTCLDLQAQRSESLLSEVNANGRPPIKSCQINLLSFFRDSNSKLCNEPQSHSKIATLKVNPFNADSQRSSRVLKKPLASAATPSLVPATPTATENDHKPWFISKSGLCPWYKKIPNSTFTVDAFRYGKIPGCTAYFLSHFHSDHYGGLTKQFAHGPIYCSKVTANLVVGQLRVRADYVEALPMNEQVQVENAFVTLIDANHCPGATLFLFEIRQQSGIVARYLHTGDFRAHTMHIDNPLLNSNRLDLCYLDTTYLKPVHKFPPQDLVVKALEDLTRRVIVNNESIQDVVAGKPEPSSNKVDRSPPSIMKVFLSRAKANTVAVSPKRRTANQKRTLVVCGSYSIGKERVFIGVAKALSTKIYAESYKRRLLSMLEDPELDALITTKPDEADVHVVTMGSLNKETLTKFLQDNKSVSAIIALRPTGWTFRPDKYVAANDTKPFTVTSLKPVYHSAQIVTIPVPYSEHSSFPELATFVTSLDIGRIIPTVNVGNPKARAEMQRWFDTWEKERIAKRKVTDGGSEDNRNGDDETLQSYLSQETSHVGKYEGTNGKDVDEVRKEEGERRESR